MDETRTTSSTGGMKGVKLARYDLIPVGPLRELAEHFGKGARKYADNQWRQGYEWSKSIAALMRHLEDFRQGKDYDVCSNDPDGCSMVTNEGEPYEPLFPDTCYNHTGSHHMAAVAWHSFCLLEFKDEFPQHDDRYKPPVVEEPFSQWFIPHVEFGNVEIGAEGLKLFFGVDPAQEGPAMVARFTAGPHGTEDGDDSMTVGFDPSQAQQESLDRD